MYVEAAELETIGHVDTCEPPRRLRVITRETDESAQRGNGPQPFEQTLEATFTAAGPHTVLTIEIRGLPLDKIEYYGAGWQIHAENLAAHITHQEPTNTESRWSDLVATYTQQASAIR